MSIDGASGARLAPATRRRAATSPSRARPRDPRGRRAGAAAVRRPLDRGEVERFLERATLALERHRQLLDRLDAALGDGDHGENMATGFRAVVQSVAATGERNVGALLRHIGQVLVASVGGASGPLYGTAFIEAGFALGTAERLDMAHIADALEAGVRGLARRGRCTVGDKTILDALEPAARAFRGAVNEGAPEDVALVRAAWAARTGMRSTTPLVARRGLALRLGERSRGHQDPGATSCFLLVRAMLPSRREHGPAGPDDSVGLPVASATGPRADSDPSRVRGTEEMDPRPRGAAR